MATLQKTYRISLVSCVLFGLSFPVHAEPVTEDSFDPAGRHYAGLIEDGYDALLYRLHLIEQASTSVDVQTFIWLDDVTGRLFMNACVEAAQRGVRVRVLMDHMYSDKNPNTCIALARSHPNLQIKRYRPPRNKLNQRTLFRALYTAAHVPARNQRMHNKTLIVDGRWALITGRNISDVYFNQSRERNYRDRDVLLAGPTVDDVARSFDEYWSYDRSISIAELKDVRAKLNAPDAPVWTLDRSEYRSLYFERLFAELNDPASTQRKLRALMHPVKSARVTADAPGKNKHSGYRGIWGGSPTAATLRDILRGASVRIDIQSTYLILNRKSYLFFKELKKNTPGLTINVSTNSYASTGNMINYSGTFRSRAKALSLGMNVFEFKPEPDDLWQYVPNMSELSGEDCAEGRQRPFTSMHAKSIVIDQELAYIGSFNFDPRSISLDTETGVVIEDPAFAALLTQSIEQDISPRNSWQAAPRNVPLSTLNRTAETISRHLPLDIWPVSSTATFAPKSRGTFATPADAEFYDLYSPLARKSHHSGIFLGAPGIK